MIPGIAEFVDTTYDKDLLLSVFDEITQEEFQGYRNCGVISKILRNVPEIETLAADHLARHDIFEGAHFEEFGTGFNYARELDHGVPPHSDWGKRGHFNLLCPLYGAAEITVFETIEGVHTINRLDLDQEGRKQWYDVDGECSHWSMKMTPDMKLTKIGSVILKDKPLLLDTRLLHSVKIIEAPRLNWVTRWVDMDPSIDFHTAKQMIEEKVK